MLLNFAYYFSPYECFTLSPNRMGWLVGYIKIKICISTSEPQKALKILHIFSAIPTKSFYQFHKLGIWITNFSFPLNHITKLWISYHTNNLNLVTFTNNTSRVMPVDLYNKRNMCSWLPDISTPLSELEISCLSRTTILAKEFISNIVFPMRNCTNHSIVWVIILLNIVQINLWCCVI